MFPQGALTLTAPASVTLACGSNSPETGTTRTRYYYGSIEALAVGTLHAAGTAPGFHVPAGAHVLRH